MVVTVAVVGVVEVSVHQVADMVGVGNRFMAAVGAVDVVLGMARANVVGCAGRRVLLRNFDAVVLHGGFTAGMVKVTVVQVIHVVVVLHGGVAAVLAVLVVVMIAAVMRQG